MLATVAQPDSHRADRERAARARLELQRRKREGGIRYWAPQEQQLPVLQCDRRGALVLGGNRGGKTVVGAAETVYRLLGTHPHRNTHRPPIKAWACSQDLPGSTDTPHKQLEELRKLIPKDALRGSEWAKAYSLQGRTLHLANGSVVVFKSYDQGPLKFESDAVDWIWFDEEPGDPAIWTSCLLRLADRDGQWMMTFTPVLSLLGKGWTERLWEDRHSDTCGYRTYQLYSLSNPYLSRGVVEELTSNLTDEERKVRLEGAFARLSGRVLGEYSESRHGCPERIPPASWRHFLVLDFGFANPSAGLFAAADPEGVLWLWFEHYAAGKRPDEHMRIYNALWQTFCAHWKAQGETPPRLDVLGDPAGFYKKSNSTGAETPSDVAEYLAEAHKLGATWFQPRKASNADPFAYRVKRYLSADMLKVCSNLKSWRWEADRWVYARQRGGIVAQEQPAPESPVDRDNHLMDVTRYLCNELPDPVRVKPEELNPSSQAALWQRLRDAQNGGGEWKER